jgi:hypothetical protein
VNWRALKAVEEKRRNLNYTIVYIQDEEVYGEVLSFGTYASTVHYLKDGFEYKLLMLNEDFEVVEQINIEEIEEEF